MKPRLVEIRAYQLKPGSAAAFHEAVVQQAMPMVIASGMQVVAYGPSAHDPENAYFLVRVFDDTAHRQAQQDAFYGSEAWKQGPREALVSRIDSYLDTVLWLSPGAIEDLRSLNGAVCLPS